MDFPAYHIYAESIAQRNMVVLYALAIVATVLGAIYLSGLARPSWRPVAAWIIGVGGFYATLALMVVRIGAGA